MWEYGVPMAAVVAMIIFAWFFCKDEPGKPSEDLVAPPFWPDNRFDEPPPADKAAVEPAPIKPSVPHFASRVWTNFLKQTRARCWVSIAAYPRRQQKLRRHRRA